MPFAKPHSEVLDEIARRQAQQQMLAQQAQTSIGGAVGALKSFNDDVIKRKAHEDVLAQQGIENTRADNAANLEQLRFGETKAQNVAANTRAAAELRLHQGADERAGAADERAATEAGQRTLKFETENAHDLLGKAVDAFYLDPQNQNPKAVDALMQRIAGQPGFERIRPEDVQAAWSAKLTGETDKQRGVDEKRADFDLRKKTEADTNARGWASIQAEKDAAKAKAAENAGKLSPADEHRRNILQEVESRKRTIKTNVDDLKAQIDKYGTKEAFGPEDEIMNAKLVSIATDLAKIKDPSTAAMKGEVDRELAAMGLEPTRMMSGDTMKSILDNIMVEAENRAKETYRTRGVTADASGQVGAPAGAKGSTAPPSDEAKQIAQQLLSSGKSPDEVRAELTRRGLM